MKNSIMQNTRECYVTGRTDNLHKHHIYGGARRKLSEKYGLWVYLTGEYHNQSGHGVHFDHELDLRLKRAGQFEFEREYSRAEWIRIFGKSYL